MDFKPYSLRLVSVGFVLKTWAPFHPGDGIPVVNSQSLGHILSPRTAPVFSYLCLSLLPQSLYALFFYFAECSGGALSSASLQRLEY